MPTAQQIRDEANSDPAGLGYAAPLAARNDEAIHALMADADARTKLKPMRMSAFTQFLMGRALLRKIRDSEANGALPASIRDICYGLLLLIQGASDRDIDPTDATTVAMIDALVAAGVATAEDKAAFLAACTKPCSRVDELGWGGLTVGRLSSALNGEG